MSTDINEARALAQESEQANTNNKESDSHVESFTELIQSISESLRHQDGKTLQDCAKLCGMDVTYLGNFNYEVKHG
jgi:hypothetical protein